MVYRYFCMSFNVFIAKINRLEDSILTKLNEIEARMSTQLNDVVTSTSGLEARMSTKLDEVVDQSIKRFERSITIKYNQGIESVKLTNRREFEKIEASIQTIQWGLQNALGTSFELFNLVWLQKFLSINHPHINLEMSKHFVDVNNIVNKDTREFEIDIYSEFPRVIAECTTYVQASEMDKAKKLLRIKKFFEVTENVSDLKLSLITFDVNEEIRNDVIDFCKNSQIELIMKAQNKKQKKI